MGSPCVSLEVSFFGDKTQRGLVKMVIDLTIPINLDWRRNQKRKKAYIFGHKFPVLALKLARKFKFTVTAAN